MGVVNQIVDKKYAIYNCDCIGGMKKLPNESIHLSVYSPPFYDLYNYSSSEKDLSNCKSYKEFLKHYTFVVEEISRLTMPGRLTCVHCTDIPLKGDKGFEDFPGDIIKIHKKEGFYYAGRRVIWKEPLRMAIRTRAKGLMHKQIVKDATLSDVASADYILSFRKKGANKVPVENPTGLNHYAGEDKPPADLVRKYRNWKNPKSNKLSHFTWQRYASSAWYDIRIQNVLEYKSARESEEEKHVCPLQLDVIERCIVLWSNKGETVLTPFLGVGSEVFCALINGRRGIGFELKPSYFVQAERNIKKAISNKIKPVGFITGS